MITRFISIPTLQIWGKNDRVRLNRL